MRLLDPSPLLALPLALAVGCTTGPTAYVTGRATPSDRLSALPSIEAHEGEITFSEFSPAERQTYEERRERRKQRVDEVESKELGAAIAGCIVGTLIIFSPLCLVIVPVLLPAGKATARAGANLGPPLPSLPSHDELVGVYQQIKERQIATRVAERMLGKAMKGPGTAIEPYPRLVLQTTSAGLSLDGQIFVDFSATAHIGPEITWTPTAHRFYFDFSRSRAQIAKDLDYAEQELAETFWSEYAFESLKRSAQPSPIGR